jgi:hypothetical protein
VLVRLPLAVVFLVPRLRFVPLLWFTRAPVRAVCLLRFRWVLVLLVCVFLLVLAVVVLVRGVLLLLLLVWVALFWWFCLPVRPLLVSLLWVLALRVLALLPAVALFGCQFQNLFNLVCFSLQVVGILDF